MITARKPRRPVVLPTLGDGTQVAPPEAIKLIAADLQFGGGGRDGHVADANAGEEVSDKRRADTMGELCLVLFMSSILS